MEKLESFSCSVNLKTIVIAVLFFFFDIVAKPGGSLGRGRGCRVGLFKVLSKRSSQTVRYHDGLGRSAAEPARQLQLCSAYLDTHDRKAQSIFKIPFHVHNCII